MTISAVVITLAYVHKHKPPISNKLKQRARQLRRDQTDAEKAMWRLLRDRQLNGAKFRRQHVVGNIILDFYCHDAKLAIEFDGGQHDEPEQKAHDDARTQALDKEGIRVLRFWNNDVLLNPQGVLAAIADLIAERTPRGSSIPG